MSDQPMACLTTGKVYHGPWAKGPDADGRMGMDAGHWPARSFPLAIDVEYDGRCLEWFCTTWDAWGDWLGKKDWWLIEYGAMLTHESFFDAMSTYGDEVPQEDPDDAE